MHSPETPEEEIQSEVQTNAAPELDAEELDIAADRLALAERVKSLEEELLRTRAEMENQRKRSLRDLEQARRFGLEKVLADLVQVADNLERGLEAAEQSSATVESIREGKALTLTQLNKVLKSQGVEEVDPMDQPFDPELHQAMTTEVSTKQPPGTVIRVFQKGYRLHERLLRPAMVVVSKAPDS